MQLTVLKTKSAALGSFGKGVEDSRTLNFSRSGAEGYCSPECSYHPDSTARPEKNRCYAARAEKRPDRIELARKLVRHEDEGPESVCQRALEELKAIYAKGKEVPWLRFSAFGSVPMPENAAEGFLEALRVLLDYCDMKNIPVHFPVETQAKRDFYQEAIGTRATVRVSCQSEDIWLNDPLPASHVAGTTDMTRGERLVEAKRLAAERRARTGRKAVVCPAVASRYIMYANLRAKGDRNAHRAAGDPKSKCGNCTACSLAGVDVIYPAH